MRVDGAAPRTWLLAAVAAWAMLAWLLALAGMGAHVAPLPADPALRQPLPTPRPSPPDRIGPLAQYAEIGARPLFSEDRRPQPFVLQPEGGEGTPADAFDYVLTSVLITPQVELAIVQPTSGGKPVSFHLGESADDLPNWRLVSLSPRSAVFEGPGGQKSLDLRVWNGGDAASPAAPAPPNSVSDADAAPPAAAPSAAPLPAPPPANDNGLDTPADDKAEDARAKQQMDAIRKRIEERRAQLRREAQHPPGSNP
ncbi:MAG: type II secretion system protein XpsN [Lysobacteraceae bacterium]